MGLDLCDRRISISAAIGFVPAMMWICKKPQSQHGVREQQMDPNEPQYPRKMTLRLPGMLCVYIVQTQVEYQALAKTFNINCANSHHVPSKYKQNIAISLPPISTAILKTLPGSQASSTSSSPTEAIDTNTLVTLILGILSLLMSAFTVWQNYHYLGKAFREPLPPAPAPPHTTLAPATADVKQKNDEKRRKDSILRQKPRHTPPTTMTSICLLYLPIVPRAKFASSLSSQLRVGGLDLDTVEEDHVLGR
ncbi:hypothetical protein BKA64DRAFT_714775 [Cadophora sp. MPI-SDFR-AT-0126]|nr:hypothetical protein BKA64DRAFT_714775 [Leotiomycetes sp. MPI-SDFR-AT-0126]